MKNLSKRVIGPGMLFWMLFAVGCEPVPVEFHDDLDLNICILCDQSDLLNTPYVIGTDIRFSVYRQHEGPDLDEAVLASTDASVLSLYEMESESDRVRAQGKALSSGTIELVLYENEQMNDVISSAEIVVAQPDDAHFYFAGPIIIDRESMQTETEGAVRIVAGGTAAFLVEYTKNGERLYGNGVLVPHASSQSVLVEVDHVYFFENNDWLIVTPMVEGTYTVDVEVGGQVIDTLIIEAVSEDSIETVSVFEEKEPKGHSDGGKVFVWAVGKDANGEWIYGVDFEWALDNVVDDLCVQSPAYEQAVMDAIEEAIMISEEEGVSWEEAYEELKPNKEDYAFESCAGDLFSYHFDEDAEGTSLEASHGEKSDSTVIHYDPEESVGVLNTEQAIGCNASNQPGSPARTALWISAVLWSVSLLRRRHLLRDC